MPSTRTTERPRGRTSGSAAIAGSGGADRRARAGDRGRRVDPVERVEDRPRRRQQLVEAAQDQRALDVLAQLCGARSVQRDGAEDPGQPEGDAATSGRAAGAVGEVEAAARGSAARAGRAPTLSSVTATSAPTSSAPSAASSGA